MRIKTSNIIILTVFLLLIAFVVKMILVFEQTGAIPDTLVSCVLGGGLLELALTAWIKVIKVKNGDKESEE